ncbi:MAG: hypothetical protein ACREXX_04340 [Gammaproteobacteria bacterium]
MPKTLNGALYEIPPGDIDATDDREAGYCRKKVDHGKIEYYNVDLSKAASTFVKPKDGDEVWIYETMEEWRKNPNADVPIVQSYVDVFPGGVPGHREEVRGRRLCEGVRHLDEGGSQSG